MPIYESLDRWGRAEYGLTRNATMETGGVVVGDEVKVTIDVEAVRV